MSKHGTAHGNDGGDHQGRGNAEHAQPHGDQDQQRDDDEAHRNRSEPEDQHRGGGQQAEKHQCLDDLPRTAQHLHVPARQRQTKGPDDGQPQGMSEPPCLEGGANVRATHGIEAQRGEQGRRNGRNQRRPQQESPASGDGAQVQARREPAGQRHRQHNLDHIGDGEHHREQRRISDQELPDKNSEGDQSTIGEVIDIAARGPQPDDGRKTAAPPQRGHQARCPGEIDRQHDQQGHTHRSQDRHQRLREYRLADTFGDSRRPHRGSVGPGRLGGIQRGAERHSAYPHHSNSP